MSDATALQKLLYEALRADAGISAMIGGRVYHILGGRGFVKIFFGGVLAGSVLHLLFHPQVPTPNAAACSIPGAPCTRNVLIFNKIPIFTRSGRYV